VIKYRFFEINGSAYHKNFVLEMVQELTKNATCIIVSHDPSIYNSGLFPKKFVIEYGVLKPFLI
jgi:ABC-type lipoprotein export system ATPase subunit